MLICVWYLVDFQEHVMHLSEFDLILIDVSLEELFLINLNLLTVDSFDCNHLDDLFVLWFIIVVVIIIKAYLVNIGFGLKSYAHSMHLFTYVERGKSLSFMQARAHT